MVSTSIQSYKMDNRSEEEFKESMKRGIENEEKVMSQFKKILKNSATENYNIIYVGSEDPAEEGKLILDENGDVANIDLFPDYLIKYKENRRIQFKFIEIKTCAPYSNYLYFKVKQLKQYVDLGSVLILFVMGVNTKTPNFILVKPEDILALDINPEMIYGKETIKVHANMFNWEPFIPIYRDQNIISKQYIKLSKEGKR